MKLMFISLFIVIYTKKILLLLNTDMNQHQSDSHSFTDNSSLSSVKITHPNDELLGITIDNREQQLMESVVLIARNTFNETHISENNDDMISHCGHSISGRSISPLHLFKKSSKSMSRHSRKWLGLCPSPTKYKDSDNGRRKKVEKISELSIFGFSDDKTEYESPDEDWFYDPRAKCKWNWENDYSSLASTSNDDATS